jgi:hypothetical protein
MLHGEPTLELNQTRTARRAYPSPCSSVESARPDAGLIVGGEMPYTYKGSYTEKLDLQRKAAAEYRNRVGRYYPAETSRIAAELGLSGQSDFADDVQDTVDAHEAIAEARAQGGAQ